MEDAARAALNDRNGHPFAQPDPFTRSESWTASPPCFKHRDMLFFFVFKLYVTTKAVENRQMLPVLRCFFFFMYATPYTGFSAGSAATVRSAPGSGIQRPMNPNTFAQ